MSPGLPQAHCVPSTLASFSPFRRAQLSACSRVPTFSLGLPQVLPLPVPSHMQLPAHTCHLPRDICSSMTLPSHSRLPCPVIQIYLLFSTYHYLEKSYLFIYLLIIFSDWNGSSLRALTCLVYAVSDQQHLDLRGQEVFVKVVDLHSNPTS